MRAELVAFGVEQGDPATLGFVELTDMHCAQRHEFGRSGVKLGRFDVNVEVHPVLRSLAFGHLEEEHARPDTVGIDDGERPVGIRLVDTERSERRLPRVES